MAVDLNKVRPVAMWAIGDLSEYENNARTHDPSQLRELARSIEKYGWTNPLLIDEGGLLIAGHGRLAAAKIVGVKEVPCIVVDGLSDAEKKALVLADNQLATLSGWDETLLAKELAVLAGTGFDISALGFADKELNKLLADLELPESPAAETEKSDRPGENMDKKNAEAHSPTGTVWQLGLHRVMCGDSTSGADVEKLTGGEDGQLIHADPPYGMGKSSDGVANDNLYREKLDEFQMAWWAVWRRYTVNNGSAYIWGNAPDLWRLWYAGGLADSEVLSIRNELVWNKENIAGMGSDLMTQYAEASERCLFIQFGQQRYTDKSGYWEGWESIRSYLLEQKELAQFTSTRVNEICGNKMSGHWFGKSQWALISEENYNKLQSAADGVAFCRPWADIKSEHEILAAQWRGDVGDSERAEFKARRAYFNNAHDAMGDVWVYPRVVGEERHGHATPKPVAMMERIMKTSLQRGGGVPRAVWWKRQHAYGCGENGARLLQHGAAVALRRHHSKTLAKLYRATGGECRNWRSVSGAAKCRQGRGLAHV